MPGPDVLGWDEVTSTAYRWPGKDRPGQAHLQVYQYTLSGCGAIDVDGATYPVPEGTGFLARLYDPRICYYYPDGSEQPWRFFYLVFHGAAAQVDALTQQTGPVLALARNGEFVSRCIGCLDAAMQRPIGAAEGQEWISMLFGELCRVIEDEAHGEASGRLVSRAIAFMQQHLESPAGIAETAAFLGVTREHFCRVFRAHMGMPPQAYFQSWKMRHAAALLRNGEESVKEIAARFGFLNVSNFSRLFRAVTGRTPGFYRNTAAPDLGPAGRPL